MSFCPVVFTPKNKISNHSAQRIHDQIVHICGASDEVLHKFNQKAEKTGGQDGAIPSAHGAKDDRQQAAQWYKHTDIEKKLFEHRKKAHGISLMHPDKGL